MNAPSQIGTPQLTCRNCRSNLIPWLNMPIDAKKNQPTEYASTVQCPNCGLGVVSVLPPEHLVPDFYKLDHYYTHASGSHMAPVSSTLADRILQHLAWRLTKSRQFDPVHITLPSRARVLDLGCGNGVYLSAFKGLGHEVLGVDPDAAARDHAAEAGITVYAGTAERMPAELDSQTFDLVIMSHSLEHCLDPAKALKNCGTATKPGGLLFIEVPNIDCHHFKMFGVCSEMFDAPRHLYFFGAKSLREMVTSAGFKFEEWIYHGFERQHAPSWRNWESTIWKRVKAREPTSKIVKHTFWRSCLLLAKTAFANPFQRYDCIGVLARKPEV